MVLDVKFPGIIQRVDLFFQHIQSFIPFSLFRLFHHTYPFLVIFPTGMYVLSIFVIIIGIKTNENDRYMSYIMERSQDIGHIPIVFIRFNPDDYNKCQTQNLSRV